MTCLQCLKDALFPDGLPPFLVCKIFADLINTHNMDLEPKNICHADLNAYNTLLSPKMEQELPQVRIEHLKDVAVWDEQAVVKQIMNLLQYLTNCESRIPDEFRTTKKGEKLKDSKGRSLGDGDRLYSFVAGYDPQGQLSWKDLKRRWRNLADCSAKELYDKGRSADIRETLWDAVVGDEE
ncbi:hypothetical protein J4E93_000002 [Alternaria ventricosa]|uniref:uncharacterized protein n=1 Tax=Alternaria ventricosa TaxID=1187951 RepID=UPI0020C45281|nr:uncharacterized protein J4E93_000002 [Alternaria ventricosa]KAI4655292.1 hypothetical protein J4E93_000002 [Alternaria ventricosa]